MSDMSPTAATVITFAEDLEDQTAACYDALAGRFLEQAGQFERFAQRAAQTKMEVVRTYRETVSDALETNFSFADVDLNTYRGCWDAPEGTDLAAVAAQLLVVEQKAVTFYSDMAETSESLLATIPAAFRRAAKVRTQRITRLERMAG